MSIDFSHPKNKHTYATRTASPEWKEQVREILDPQGMEVADIGCGGGIYSRALAEMGAQVTGVDPSPIMLEAAQEQSDSFPQIRWIQGSAEQTGLPAGSFHFLLMRAVIHHLRDLLSCFHEAARILRPGGILLIQDRTPADCLLPATPDHLRGFIFEMFPRLKEKEIARRHPSVEIHRALKAAGFYAPWEHPLWETRRIHRNLQDLEQDILQRQGRSILHELHDEELHRLMRHIRHRLTATDVTTDIPDRDRWTLWTTRKGGSDTQR